MCKSLEALGEARGRPVLYKVAKSRWLQIIVCALLLWGSPAGQRMVSNSLDEEVQEVVSYHMDAGN